MIDSHQHFWRYSAEEYDWIDDRMTVIRRDFIPDDLTEVAAPLGLEGSVAVQARQSLVETRWLLELAAQNPFIKGVVGWVPLAAARVGADLDELRQNPVFKGVRHVVQAEADPQFLAGEEFNAGIREVTARGLVYDVLITAPQLEATLALVDRHPEQSFVLDHIAKPVVAGAPPSPWREQIAQLAERPQVSCKFSGVVTEVTAAAWSSDLIEPYGDVVLNAFGPERLMFGSDWPVCLVRSSYARWYHTVRQWAAKLSAGEQARIMGGTAREIYGLA